MSNSLLQRGKSQESHNFRWYKYLRIFALLTVLVVFCTLLALNYISGIQWWEKQVGQSGSVVPPVNPTLSSVLDTTRGPYDIIYPYKYKFILDEPEKCKGQNPFLVLMVPIEPHDRASRDIIRRTWGNESTVPGVSIRLLFLLGLPENPESLQEELHEESREHHDLLQSNFRDSYLNLTIKTMMMMEWLVSRCPDATYAAKVDKDMFLNVDFLVNKLLEPHKPEPKLNYITGAVIYGGIVRRDPGSKWYVPEEVFPNAMYPCYVSGNAYVFSMDLPGRILVASQTVKPFHLEDVYLGMCLQHLGIMPSVPPWPNLFLLNWHPYDHCSFSHIVSVTGVQLDKLDSYWADFNTPSTDCS